MINSTIAQNNPNGGQMKIKAGNQVIEIIVDQLMVDGVIRAKGELEWSFHDMPMENEMTLTPGFNLPRVGAYLVVFKAGEQYPCFHSEAITEILN